MYNHIHTDGPMSRQTVSRRSQVQSGENSEKELLKAINTRFKHCFIYSIYFSSILGSFTLNRSFQANQAWYDSIESMIFKIRFNRNMISLRLRLEFYFKKLILYENKDFWCLNLSDSWCDSYKALQCFDLRWFCHNIKGESMLFGKLKNVVSKHTWITAMHELKKLQ